MTQLQQRILDDVNESGHLTMSVWAEGGQESDLAFAIGVLNQTIKTKEQEIAWLERELRKTRDELAHMTQLLDRPEWTARNSEDYI